MERGVQDPFALINLLPAGVICLTLSPLEDRQDTAAGEDGWDLLHTPSLIPCVTCDQDDILLRQLEFLTIHEFILATCRVGPKSTFYIRIYLIPFDLPNVQGRLRTRDEEIMSPARKFLKVVLPRADQNVARWEAGDPSSGSVKCLIPQNIVTFLYSVNTMPCFGLLFYRTIVLCLRFTVICLPRTYLLTLLALLPPRYFLGNR
jgi:hypothetical protein